MQDARDCLAELEQLAMSGSDMDSADLLGQVTDLYLATADRHTDDDIASFGKVMERLAYKLDADPRAAFAERIADAETVPRRLLRRMATDQIVVAEPILSRSQSLSEQDLEEIATTCEPDYLLALSRRPLLSLELADLIVNRGDRKALIALAANDDLALSRRGFVKLLRRAETIRELQEIIDRRGVVGADVLSRIWLLLKGWQTDVKPEECGGSAPESGATANLPAADEDPQGRPAADAKAQFERLSEEADAEKTDTKSMLLDAARANDLPEVLRCLCALTETDQTSVEHLLLEAELRPFSVFCKAHDIDGTTFASLAQLRVETGQLQAGEVVKAMRRYAAMSSARAQELLNSIQQQ